jgi:hypothetical protein
MRKFFLAALAVAVALPAFAELQNVTVSGSIRIRANYYTGLFATPTGVETRWPGFLLPDRPINFFTGNSVLSGFGWNKEENSADFIEQRTKVGVKADFTDQVGAFIEFDSYDVWGNDFRSVYQTGADFNSDGVGSDDVALYQAYIEAEEMYGYPLRLRLGRQEIALGSQWLVGTNDTSSFFGGLSFDAARLTYATDMFSMDAFAATLFEGGIAEEDEDVWFYGLYGSYLGIENITIDAYWLYLRDATQLNDTNGLAFPEWIEDILGLDDYDPTTIHTIGLRGAGTYGAFDFEAEIAYQWGDAGQIGFGVGIPGGRQILPFVYGDDSAEYSNWAGHFQVGYTFDMNYKPRVFLGGVYLGGEDNRDVSFWEWLNPFDRPEASVSFNRLFSNWEYTEFLANTDETNMWMARGGASISPTESTNISLAVMYCQALEEFDVPRHVTLGRFRVPIAPALSFWTEENDSVMGWEVGLYGTYNYSEDLTFNAGWAHFFTDDGATDGQFTALNGTAFTGGSDDDDADYLFVESIVKF